MDEHSTVRGHLYYLLTLKIITCLARAETWLVSGQSGVEDLHPRYARLSVTKNKIWIF